MSDKNVLIQVKELKKAFGSNQVLDGITTDICQGEVVAIIGPSGSGKSTFLRSLNLLEVPTGGQILFEGTDITDPKTDIDKHRQKMGMVFQQFNLFPHMTILDNMTLAPMKLLGRPKDEAETEALKLLERVGLKEKASAYPGQLSGGQKQRVGIARALANNPSILLCDEATSALDPKTTDSILDLLKKINETLHITIVIITHEMNVIQKICNKVAVMDFGKVVETGSVIQVFSDPQSDIAKRFVGNLIHDVIPEPLVESIRRETRNSRLLRIKLENTDSTEPLLWDINRRFEVETNILYSTLNVIQGIVVGIMLVLFIGSDEEIKKAERYILESNEEYKEVVLP